MRINRTRFLLSSTLFRYLGFRFDGFRCAQFGYADTVTPGSFSGPGNDTF